MANVNKCPYCFRTLGTWQKDPILLPNGCPNEWVSSTETTRQFDITKRIWKGTYQITEPEVQEIQDYLKNLESTYSITPLTTFSPLNTSGKFQITGKHIKEMRDSVENILTFFNQTKTEYFNCDSDDNLITQYGGGKIDWTDPITTSTDLKKFQVKYIHIEDLRHYIRSIYWAETFSMNIISQTNTPPSSPNINDKYIVTAFATGAWLGRENYIAKWNGSQWTFKYPASNREVWIENESKFYKFMGAGIGWVEYDTDETITGDYYGEGFKQIDNVIYADHDWEDPLGLNNIYMRAGVGTYAGTHYPSPDWYGQARSKREIIGNNSISWYSKTLCSTQAHFGDIEYTSARVQFDSTYGGKFYSTVNLSLHPRLNIVTLGSIIFDEQQISSPTITTRFNFVDLIILIEPPSGYINYALRYVTKHPTSSIQGVSPYIEVDWTNMNRNIAADVLSTLGYTTDKYWKIKGIYICGTNWISTRAIGGSSAQEIYEQTLIIDTIEFKII